MNSVVKPYQATRRFYDENHNSFRHKYNIPPGKFCCKIGFSLVLIEETFQWTVLLPHVITTLCLLVSFLLIMSITVVHVIFDLLIFNFHHHNEQRHIFQMSFYKLTVVKTYRNYGILRISFSRKEIGTRNSIHRKICIWQWFTRIQLHSN